MDVLIKSIEFVKAEDAGGIICADDYGKVIRHDIDVIVQTKDVTISGTFRFKANQFSGNTSMEDYKNAIKNLFKEREE